MPACETPSPEDADQQSFTGTSATASPTHCYRGGTRHTFNSVLGSFSSDAGALGGPRELWAEVRAAAAERLWALL